MPTVGNLRLPANRPGRSRFRTHSLSLGILATLILTPSARAAERIDLSYGRANISVSVEALETYARSGKIDEELASYLLLLKPEDREQFRAVLLDSYPFNPVMVSQFLNSPTGEIFLRRLGDLIRTQSANRGSNNGSDAIKTALIKAADSPEGLTLPNILRQFPASGIEFDTERMFALRDQIRTLLAEMDAVVAEIADLSSREAALAAPVDWHRKPDLRRSGPFGTLKRTLTLRDEGRNRTFVADLHIPTPLKAAGRGEPDSVPVVVISHGLAANRGNYADLGRHLASHGFLAVLPQHPGSDTDRLAAVLSGEESSFFDVTEFIDRPSDITYLLDELERRNAVEFGGQLDLNRVGVAGHSFGAYTALAVGGAAIDFDNLRRECTDAFDSVNLALMFQCRALELPQQSYPFRDERVKAIFPINPVNSSIFGRESLGRIDIPILWKTSGEDTVAPVAWEQVRSFTWLRSPSRYLLLAEGDHHVNLNLSAVNLAVSSSLQEIVEPPPEVVGDYINAFGLAFFKVYLENDIAYRPYLQASYARAIADPDYPLNLVKTVAPEQFYRAVRRARDRRESEIIDN